MKIIAIPVRPIIASILFAAFALQSCGAPVVETQAGLATKTPGDIPTWTPRPGDLPDTLQTPTRPATVTPAPSAAPAVSPTPAQVAVQATDGNLNIRRGPSVDYNPIGVLRDGQTVTATGRDLVSRWLQVPLPSAPGKSGWISTLTDYSIVTGDVEELPVVTVPPASPAYIRNCTKNRMLVLPLEIELLGKYDEPYNEERFPPGEYQVYDLEAGVDDVYETVHVSEGSRVDITEDGLGDKSKCE